MCNSASQQGNCSLTIFSALLPSPYLMPPISSLPNQIKPSKTQKESYKFQIRATDSGSPPLHADVDVELEVVDRNNKPPVWDQSVYGPIYLKENTQPGGHVISVKARLDRAGG